MNKYHFLIGTIAATLLFSGCSSKDVKITKNNITDRDIDVAQITSYTLARTINATNRSFLQASAEETIRSGYKTFSFTYPDLIADGSIKNTDDFLLKCADKSALANIALGVVTLGIGSNFVHDDCNIFVLPFVGEGASSGSLTMSNEQDKGIDALAVIEVLKIKNLYKEISVEHIGLKK